jgi:heat-inducible transcriptional repressor
MQISLVAASYGAGQSPLGSLGIIGPMRMDYARVIPIVRYTASMVSHVLNKRQT